MFLLGYFEPRCVINYWFISPSNWLNRISDIFSGFLHRIFYNLISISFFSFVTVGLLYLFDCVALIPSATGCKITDDIVPRVV